MDPLSTKHILTLVRTSDADDRHRLWRAVRPQSPPVTAVLSHTGDAVELQFRWGAARVQRMTFSESEIAQALERASDLLSRLEGFGYVKAPL